MLAVTSYKPDYVAACRARIARQLAAYRAIATKTDVAAFEADYFSTMILALDSFFLHRQRSNEGKDGNPINEVRMLCNGIKDNDGVLAKDTTIKYDAGKSLTGIGIGQTIALDAATFERLAMGFFEAIEKRYP